MTRARPAFRLSRSSRVWLLEDHDGLVRVGGLKDAVAIVSQMLRNRHADENFVLNEQDRLDETITAFRHCHGSESFLSGPCDA